MPKTTFETVYLNHEQAVAVEQAIYKAAREGFLYDSIRVKNNGKDKGSWMEVEPTNTKDLFILGLRAGFILKDLKVN